MVKENNVYIKIEVCKDKVSGKLFLQAHFDSKAPNFIKEKDYYAWVPTREEKTLLNEAFEFMPMLSSPTHPEMTSPKIETKKEEKSFSKFFSKEEKKAEPEIEIKEKEPEIPQLEKEEGSDVFEITDKDDSDEFEKVSSDSGSTFEKIKAPKEEKPIMEEEKSTEYRDDDGIIVEADSDAIEKALEKHMGRNDDKSIVEADEKTIIDRVLKQKKKGKWRE